MTLYSVFEQSTRQIYFLFIVKVEQECFQALKLKKCPFH
jgi:hypothetical protein